MVMILPRDLARDYRGVGSIGRGSLLEEWDSRVDRLCSLSPCGDGGIAISDTRLHQVQVSSV